jgi:hypothetical protein
MKKLLSYLFIFLSLLSCSNSELESLNENTFPIRVIANNHSDLERNEININYTENKITSVDDMNFIYENSLISKIETFSKAGSSFILSFKFEYENNKLKYLYKYSYYNNKISEILKSELSYIDNNIIIEKYVSIESDNFSSFIWIEKITLESNDGNITKQEIYPTYKDFYNNFLYNETSSPFSQIDNFEIFQIVPFIDQFPKNYFFEMFGLFSKGVKNISIQRINVNKYTNTTDRTFEYEFEYINNLVNKIEIKIPESSIPIKEHLLEY